MAIELRLSKPDASAHWGFRLVGGADFNEPLVVVKVNENSHAEDAGLMVGDVVVRVNDVPTAGLTHADAHDLINKAGINFVMAIRRGLFSDIPVPSRDDNNNEEIKDILRNSFTAHLDDLQKDQEIGPSPTFLENLAGQEQLVESTSADPTGKFMPNGRPKKFSTFLVKPKNPKPVSKQVEEQRKLLGDPYRVKIVKQPKRDPKDVLHHKKTVKFEPNVIEVEISRESSVADSTDSQNIFDLEDESGMEIETSVQVTEETTIEVQEMDDENEEDNERAEIKFSPEVESNEDSVTIKKTILKPPLEIHIDPVISESSLSLEQQLAAVQKQLLALSQLPSAIQVTLEAVTQQLNQIVMEKTSLTETNNDISSNDYNEDTGIKSPEDDMIDENNVSTSENAEGDITENEADDDLEELNEDQPTNDLEEVIETDESPQQEKGNESEVPVVTDPYAGLTEEEKEAKVKEERILAKKQKVNHWNQIWPWGDNKKLIYRHFSSINFLKFTPPSKNLDYLQRSEVYRLIHDMEPPLRGVGARAEKVLSENDYYGDKGAP